MSIILEFLSELAKNNNREWFQEHKEEYERAKDLFEQQVQSLIERMSLYDPSLMGLEVKDCTWRIYRDVRFSYDKRPFKTHFGAFLVRGGKKSPHSGYYIHFEAGACLMGGGIWCPDPKLLKALRQSVFDHTEEFVSILKAPDFYRLYPELDTEGMLKTIPRNFPRDFAYPELLKVKSYLVSHALPDSFFSQSDWIEQAAEKFQHLLPFHQFMNHAVDLFYEK
ncbi:MAG: DUF2461 domain-containing protein [Bacteroidales bacterium]